MSEAIIREQSELIVPKSLAAFEAALAAYVAGRGDFAEVLEDLNRWLGAKSDLSRQQAARFTTWAQAQRLGGTETWESGGSS